MTDTANGRAQQTAPESTGLKVRPASLGEPDINPAVLRSALTMVWDGCREHCERAAPAARLLGQLGAPCPDGKPKGGNQEMASAWGRAMAVQAPNEDELLWLGGLWLVTAHRLFGADSEVTESLGQWFAMAAEEALTQNRRSSGD